jgi:hypothetical protein
MPKQDFSPSTPTCSFWFGAPTAAQTPSLESPDERLQQDQLRIPTKPITDSELMAIAIPEHADRRRGEATLSCSYRAEVIGIRQSFCG